MNISMQIRRSVAAIALSAVVSAFAIAQQGTDTDTVSLTLPIFSAMSVSPTCAADAVPAQGGKICYEASVVVGQPVASVADTAAQTNAGR